MKKLLFSVLAFMATAICSLAQGIVGPGGAITPADSPESTGFDLMIRDAADDAGDVPNYSVFLNDSLNFSRS